MISNTIIKKDSSVFDSSTQQLLDHLMNSSVFQISSYLLNIQNIEDSNFFLFFRAVLQKREQFLDAEIYNDLSDGRLKLLFSLSLFYQRYPHPQLHNLIKDLFQLVLKDARFYRNKLSWLQSPYLGKEQLFKGNTGILLGFMLIKKIWINEDIFDNIISVISCDADINIIPLKYRNLISGNKETYNVEIDKAISIAQKTQNTALLEVLICTTFILKLDRSNNIFNKIRKLYEEFIKNEYCVANELVDIYFSGQLHDVLNSSLINNNTHKIDTLINVNRILFFNNYPIIIQYCGEEFINGLLSKEEKVIMPSLFFRELIKTYDFHGKKGLLKAIIAINEKRANQNINGLYKAVEVLDNNYREFSKLCKISTDLLFQYSFLICMEGTDAKISSIPWNNMELSQEFESSFFINKIKKLKEKKIKILSIFKPKRVGKVIIWNEIDLFGLSQTSFLCNFSKIATVEQFKLQNSTVINDERLRKWLLEFVRIGILKRIQL